MIINSEIPFQHNTKICRSHSRYDSNMNKNGDLSDFTKSREKFNLSLRKNKIEKIIEISRFSNKNCKDSINNLITFNNDDYIKICEDVNQAISNKLYFLNLLKEIRDFFSNNYNIYFFSDVKLFYDYVITFIFNGNSSEQNTFIEVLLTYNCLIVLQSFPLSDYLNSLDGLKDINLVFEILTNHFEKQLNDEKNPLENRILISQTNTEIILIVSNLINIINPENVNTKIIKIIITNYNKLVNNIHKKSQKQIEINFILLLSNSINLKLDIEINVHSIILEVLNNTKSKKVFIESLDILTNLIKINENETLKIFNDHSYLIERTLVNLEKIYLKSNSSDRMRNCLNFLKVFIINIKTKSNFINKYNIVDYMFHLLKNEKEDVISDVFLEIVDLFLECLDINEVDKFQEEKVKILCEILNQILHIHERKSVKSKKSLISIIFLIVKSENSNLLKMLYENKILEIILKTIILLLESNMDNAELLQCLKIFYIMSHYDKIENYFRKIEILNFYYEIEYIFSMIYNTNENKFISQLAYDIINLLEL